MARLLFIVMMMDLVFAKSILPTKPNIVFLICESTDSRTYNPDSNVPLPNIDKLLKQGVLFQSFYANAPVCCPSRSSLWSGRAPHKIPHEHNGIQVNGVWNNYEGLPKGYNMTITDLLKANGYETKISGKKDWTVGGHSENVYLNSWTMYTRFPYDVHKHGGWYDENDCPKDPSIASNNKTERHSDWKTVHPTIDWIKKVANGSKPFFAYQGMNIVHPAYSTNEYWLNKIDNSTIVVPEWRNLTDLHPCDFQSSMLKDCTPSDKNADAFYDKVRRRTIRRVYRAMIAEFDAMVGAYYDAVSDAGVLDRTVFIVTSDHGDMDMEHQQFYKMVPYDASSRVPCVISGPGISPMTTNVPTQLLDLFPTMMDLAGIPKPDYLDGSSLVPLLTDQTDPTRPDYVISQFHGCNIAMSWFLIRQGDYKYVTYGTGKEVTPQLFNLVKDPDENVNLVNVSKDIAKKMEATLSQAIDYPAVALDVATYGLAMFHWWVNKTGSKWVDEIHKSSLRWANSWNVDPDASLEAVKMWMNQPPQVLACRSELVWPPPKDQHYKLAN